MIPSGLTGLLIWLEGVDGNNTAPSTIWSNRVENGNNMTLVNFDYSSTDGWTDTGVVSDGSGSYGYSNSNLGITGAEARTIVAKIKMNQMLEKSIIGIGTADNGNAFDIMYYQSNLMIHLVGTNSLSAISFPMTQGEETLVSVVYDGVNAKMYKNGTLMGTWTCGALTTGDAPLRLFHGGSGSQFDNSAAEVKGIVVYNTALSDTDRQSVETYFSTSLDNGAEGGQTYPAITPNNLSGLLVWLKADSIVGTDNQTVSIWNDSSGKANNAVQNTDGVKPLFKKNILNDKPVVYLDGVDDYMTFTAQSNVRTAIVVSKMIARQSYGPILADTSAYPFYSTSSSSNYVIDPQYAAVAVSNGMSWQNGRAYTPAYLTWGTDFDIKTFQTTDNISLSEFGRDRTYTDSMINIEYAEIILFNRVLTETERKGVEEYLYEKYFMTVPPGSGTEADPYRIASDMWLTNFTNITNWDTSYFELMNDIDLNGVTVNPIGDATTPFKGHFKGNGYTLSNLVINKTADNTGLFGVVSGAVISNIKLDKVSITGQDNTGIIGKAINSNISLILSAGDIKGTTCIGGIVGYNDGSTVNKCDNESTVEATQNYAAGIVGYQDGGAINNSFNKGTITSPDYASGLVAYIQNNGTVDKCYSSNLFNCNGIKGGLVAYAQSGQYNVTDSYWDTTLSGLTDSYGGTGKAGLLFVKKSTFANWDFTTIWKLLEGSMPTLLIVSKSVAMIPINGLDIELDLEPCLAPDGGNLVLDLVSIYDAPLINPGSTKKTYIGLTPQTETPTEADVQIYNTWYKIVSTLEDFGAIQYDEGTVVSQNYGGSKITKDKVYYFLASAVTNDADYTKLENYSNQTSRTITVPPNYQKNVVFYYSDTLTRPATIGYLHVMGKNGLLKLNIASADDALVIDKMLRIQLKNQIGVLDLVDATNAEASPVRIMTKNGVKAVRRID